uniref:Uncharacterized protein n=1 Tax=Anguilla anguilla TaxID=7936 RepID=A0A0E9SLB2_ANGAN
MICNPKTSINMEKICYNIIFFHYWWGLRACYFSPFWKQRGNERFRGFRLTISTEKSTLFKSLASFGSGSVL